MPTGETTVTYENSEYIIIDLNNKGNICGVQEYFDEKNEKVSIKHKFINPALEWTKVDNSTFYAFNEKIDKKNVLTKNFEKYYTCQHLGKLFAIYCQEISMKIIDGFPMGTS